MDGYRSLSGLGIKTVLNLSTEGDAEEAKRFGIKEIYAPMRFFRDVDAGKMQEHMQTLSDTSLYPLYVHCAQGCDRTGMVVACYRIESGWSNEDAIAEMDSFGFHYVWGHFLEFVKNYKSVN
jgi:protein tyrosine/serine phosphatase